MLDDVTTDYLVEFVIWEGIGQDAQVVNDIRLGSGIRIYSNRAGIFILSTSDIKNLSREGD